MKKIYSLQIEKDYLPILSETYTDIANSLYEEDDKQQIQNLALLSRLGHLKTEWACLDNGDKVLLLELK